jgi:predicted O-linked N-acetylglucosamine transferase (SPINDLY family)
VRVVTDGLQPTLEDIVTEAPLAFQRWMLILQHVPESVLWLLKGSEETNARVKQLAAQYRVARSA